MGDTMNPTFPNPMTQLHFNPWHLSPDMSCLFDMFFSCPSLLFLPLECGELSHFTFTKTTVISAPSVVPGVGKGYKKPLFYG